jgi:signal transduction histidine kinase
MRFATPAFAVDAALATAMTVLVQAAIWAGVGVSTADRAGTIAGRPALLALLFAPATVCLLWRRRYPHLAVVLFAGAMAIQALSTHNTPEGAAILLPAFVVAYSLGAYGTRRQAFVAWPVLLAGFSLHAAYDRALGDNAWAAAFFWLAELGAYGIGLLVGARRHGATLRSQTARAQAERDEAARSAVAEERARIARDLHDAVARSVSVTVIHAEAAEEVLPATGSDPARASLRRIQSSGREALTEIRQMVGLLRSPDQDSLAPRPGLADVRRLADETTAAGLPVEVTITGDTERLPPGIDVSAYRIVQEALTNSLKHGAAKANVELRRERAGLAIEVHDRPGSSPARTRAGTPMSGGQGLVGIEERVRFFGGEFAAGPCADGGFSVSVRLPVPEAGAP